MMKVNTVNAIAENLRLSEDAEKDYYDELSKKDNEFYKKYSASEVKVKIGGSTRAGYRAFIQVWCNPSDSISSSKTIMKYLPDAIKDAEEFNKKYGKGIR